MLIKKKMYVLLSVGGMNSEVVGVEEIFDDLSEVYEYCSVESILDDNGVRFRNSYKEEYWERDVSLCWTYDSCVDGKVVGVYLVNEGSELLEVEV